MNTTHHTNIYKIFSGNIVAVRIHHSAPNENEIHENIVKCRNQKHPKHYHVIRLSKLTVNSLSAKEKNNFIVHVKLKKKKKQKEKKRHEKN
jgi:hypothetical protein